MTLLSVLVSVCSVHYSINSYLLYVKLYFYICYHRQPHDKYVHISCIIILSPLLDREFNSKVHSLSKMELVFKAFQGEIAHFP